MTDTSILEGVAGYIQQSLGDSPNKPNHLVMTALLGEALEAEDCEIVRRPAAEPADTIGDKPSSPCGDEDPYDDIPRPDACLIREYRSLLAIAHRTIAHIERHAVANGQIDLAAHTNRAGFSLIQAVDAVNNLALLDDTLEDLQ
ncbi:hypothetical protein DSM100688_0418 [Bifidobacterium ramosum]|uniref:Uncharacterized protein n=1 Tax=Bifidobacterium ramosum TaxID=1798158 RepID=A0A6L4X3L5_9BIFI|nr:hypothetical protein [Bifidobacterium ramosum]KAB8289338.1 hypothetical protein DSM100688_0418 [Bifidobacterium ramosum]NEG71036.1 hypothetical protein [Bifidobacterium ramosum]